MSDVDRQYREATQNQQRLRRERECANTLSGNHWWPDGGSRCQSCGLVRRYLIVGNNLIGHPEGVLVDYAEYEKFATFLRQNLPTLNPKYCKDFMDRAYELLRSQNSAHVHKWIAVGDRCGPMVTHECECGLAKTTSTDTEGQR